MADFLYGAIAMVAATAALFFLRFYRRSGDRFFLYFFASFGIEAVSRLFSVAFGWTDSDNSWFYGLRVIAYGLILVAIVDKNLPRRTPEQ